MTDASQDPQTHLSDAPPAHDVTAAVRTGADTPSAQDLNAQNRDGAQGLALSAQPTDQGGDAQAQARERVEWDGSDTESTGPAPQ